MSLIVPEERLDFSDESVSHRGCFLLSVSYLLRVFYRVGQILW